MEDTDRLDCVRSAGMAWNKVHDELGKAGVEYRDASDGVERLRDKFELAQHRSDGYYDIIKRVRSVLEDEAGVEFHGVVAEEVRALANERDTARSAVDDLVTTNSQLHEHCQELEGQLTEQASREGRLLAHNKEQASSCHDLRNRILCLERKFEEEQEEVERLERELSEEKETVDDLQWKLGEERVSHSATKGRQNYLEEAVDGRDDIIRVKDQEIDRLTEKLGEAEQYGEARRKALVGIESDLDSAGAPEGFSGGRIKWLADELSEAREEAAAEGMSRRQAENTLAEISNEIDDGPPPSDARIEGILDRHYGRKQWGVANANYVHYSGFSTIPPLLGSPSLAKGHGVRVVGNGFGVGHKGEVGTVCKVDDADAPFPVLVAFTDTDDMGFSTRSYTLHELERV